LDRAGQGAPEGLWLRAERQSAGRGRLGRQWQEQDGNLYASTILRLSDDDPPATLLALAAGIAFANAIHIYTGSNSVQLKWPNDVMFGIAKLGGILLERRDDALIAGFGLNILTTPEIPDRPVASLVDTVSKGTMLPDAATFCQTLASEFADAVGIWRQGRGNSVRRNPILEIWLNLAHSIGTIIFQT